MPVLLRSAVFACAEPARVATFWASLLARRSSAVPGGSAVAGDDTRLGLRFVVGRAPRSGLNRMHVHLTSRTLEHQRDTVATAIALGARRVDVGQRPEDAHVVLADPAGNAFCVIEPDNAYLAGTGFLGELACEGSREVGLFWSAALGWPLVWDQDGETAVQSPAGGTKVAWGGPPVPPVDADEPPRLELDVVGGPLAAEVDRLVGLGAAAVEGARDGVVVLADPDGVRFRLVAAQEEQAAAAATVEGHYGAGVSEPQPPVRTRSR